MQIDVIESSNITEAVKIEIVSDVLDTLSNSTTATVSSVSAGMGDGEIEKVTSILERVASISQDIVVTDKQTEVFPIVLYCLWCISSLFYITPCDTRLMVTVLVRNISSLFYRSNKATFIRGDANLAK